MGNTSTREQTLVDFGSLVPTGLYPDSDFDKSVVKKLITERKLAPFYKGLDEPKVPNYLRHESQSSTLSRRSNKSDNSVAFQQLYQDMIECPICFLYYPKNMNDTRCCGQPICTECFLQIKRPFTTFEPAECPYCVQPHFGVVYTCPEKKQEDEKSVDTKNNEELVSRKPFYEPTDPMVVTSDDIRPHWEEEKKKMLMEKVQNQRRMVFIGSMSDSNVTEAANVAAALVENMGRSNGRRTSQRMSVIDAIRIMGADLDELMLMEAMRRSLLEDNE